MSRMRRSGLSIGLAVGSVHRIALAAHHLHGAVDEDVAGPASGHGRCRRRHTGVRSP